MDLIHPFWQQASMAAGSRRLALRAFGGITAKWRARVDDASTSAYHAVTAVQAARPCEEH